MPEEKFSIAMFATSPFRQEERNLLSQLITDEIRHGINMIVDDVFESRNTEEYIISSDNTSAKRMREAIECYSGYKTTLKKIQ